MEDAGKPSGGLLMWSPLPLFVGPGPFPFFIFHCIFINLLFPPSRFVL